MHVQQVHAACSVHHAAGCTSAVGMQQPPMHGRKVAARVNVPNARMRHTRTVVKPAILFLSRLLGTDAMSSMTRLLVSKSIVRRP